MNLQMNNKRTADDACLSTQTAAKLSNRNCADDGEWARQLERDGYCVIENVLTEQECDAGVLGINQYFLDMGIDLDQPPKKHPNIHGIIQHLEAGQQQAVWDIRCNQRVQNVFEAMYGTNDLLASFDALCVMKTWERKCQVEKSWLHVDQSWQRKGRHCVQGYVNLTDASDARTGSLMVVPRSHERFAAFFDAYPHARSSGDWYKFASDEERAFFGEPVRVHGGKGSLVLWDSRTAHQNAKPAPDAGTPKDRYVVYTCYQPRALISAANLKKKQKAFDEYRMTSHWPASTVKLFSKTWRTYGAPVTPYDIKRNRVDSQRVLELAGKRPMTSQALRKSKPLIKFDF